MTVTTVRSAQVTWSETGEYVLELDLTPAQASRFAALTRQLSGLPGPRDELAVVIGGRVIDHPAVMGTITGGQAPIHGFATRAQAERLLPRPPNQ
jgi:preprotein translocase subunit SecD